jgi:GNAT superfamily N-acetyltransferase
VDEGNVLSGQCIVCLPDDHRFIDATVEQYRRVAHLHFGVVVGLVAESAGGDAEHRAAIGSGRMPAGARMVVQRQNLTLDYLLADDAATEVILSHPSVRNNVEAHRRAGINLASLSLEGLRRSGSADRAHAAPYPRLHALLNAIGDAPVEVDEAGDWYFRLAGDDGTVRRLRLDEIPLPETTPPAGGEEGPIDASSASVSDTLRGVSWWRPWRRGSADDVNESESDSAGLRLRLVRPSESGDVDRLLRLAGVELGPHLADAIEDGSVSSALVRAAASGQEELLRVVKAAVDTGDPTAATAALSTVVVAEAPDHALVGAALALPPLDLFARSANPDLPLLRAMVGATAVVNIKGVAAQESARGAGIGSALIRSCTERYLPLGYFLVYGFRTGSGLGTYFPRLGFKVLGPGQSLPLKALGLPIHVRPELGEQLFTLIHVS